MRNLFRPTKNKAIEDRTIGDIRDLFDQEKEDHYKPLQ